MHKATFVGENTSLTKYGIRFEPGKPVVVSDSTIAEKLEQEEDFTVEEIQLETSTVTGDGTIDKEDGPTLTELKEQAKAASIKGYSTMGKPELIAALAAQSQKGHYADSPTS
ncbi:Rho termination factor N-terminal domain-containing protein [Paenibacillus sp. FSL R10-2791]|uniref:Rho termination factor N-terminal domain-containing protein n=1 Tax=Paenibacillus sp. FSL R10-2791 TaxID=2954695 RepID=UPI0030FAB8FF